MSSLFVSFVPRVAARVANIVKVMLLFYLFIFLFWLLHRSYSGPFSFCCWRCVDYWQSFAIYTHTHSLTLKGLVQRKMVRVQHRKVNTRRRADDRAKGSKCDERARSCYGKFSIEFRNLVPVSCSHTLNTIEFRLVAQNSSRSATIHFGFEKNERERTKKNIENKVWCYFFCLGVSVFLCRSCIDLLFTSLALNTKATEWTWANFI